MKNKTLMKKINKIMNEHVKESNAKFETMSRSKRRVAICEDVIRATSMSRTKFKVVQGEYLQKGDAWTDKNSIEPDMLKDLLGKGQVQCNVCARGAMMVSRFRFKDVLDEKDREIICQGGGGDETTDILSNEFTEDELALIESFFEQDTSFIEYHPTMQQHFLDQKVDDFDDEEELADAIEENWRKVYKSLHSDSDRVRLHNIMERIIACDGNVVRALTCNSKSQKKYEEIFNKQGKKSKVPASLPSA